jgi:CTP:molybdopterin cytidylyltransferase MocA
MSVTGIVLAAGEGRRMGGPKARLALGGSFLVERHVAALARACARVVVVVRPADAAWVDAALATRPGAVVIGAITPAPAASLQAALPWCGSERVVVTPVDLLPPAASTLEALLRAIDDDVLAATPTYRGRGGHPVVVRRALLDRLSPDRTLRDVLASAGARRVRIAVEDPHVVGDLDTPSDCAAALWPSGLEVGGDRLDVGIVDLERPQRVAEAEHVLRVRSARAGPSPDVLGDLGLRQRAEEVLVVAGRDPDEALRERRSGGPLAHREHPALEAGLLADVERDQDRVGLVRRDPVRDAAARGGRIRDQRDDAAGRLRHAAVIGRALPEAARPAADEGAPALDVRERGSEDQRAVAEDPHPAGKA